LIQTPDNLQALSALAQLQMAQGNSKAAVARVEQQLKIAKDPAPINQLLGQLSLAAKDYPRAIEFLDTAVRQNPELISAYYMIGNAYAAQKRFDTALEQYQKVVAKNPRSIPAHMMIGILQDLQKQPAKANEAYQKVLELDKGFAPATNNLAWNYAEHGGDLDRALTLAQKAREARPNDPSIADTLGWIYLKKKSYPSAIGLFKESSEIFKDSNPTVVYHLALAYDKNGDEELARQTLRKINLTKQDFPDAPEAKKLFLALGGK
jgi:tetratricopeptide (TPR) repeat protein